MNDIQAMARRLAELDRVRLKLNTYSHPDDLAGAISQALQYVGGTTEAEAVIALLVVGLDGVIAQEKDRMREALK